MDSILPITGAIAGGAAWMSWAVRGRASSVFASSVWRGPQDRRAVALTFDDGPSEGTLALLDLLSRFGVRATFFQCGVHVRRRPSIARAVAMAGHEIGNHSDSHPLFCFRSAAYMHAELSRAQAAIQEHTGCRPAWFRAPYGVRWPGLRAAQEALGLNGVMWTVMGRDYRLPGVAVANRVLKKGAANGAIICLHDGRELAAKPDIRSTLEAIRIIVPALLDRGFRLETVTGLFKS